MLKKIIFRLMKRLSTPENFARKQGVVIGVDNFIATTHWGTEPYLIEIGSHCQITAGVKFHTHGGAQVLRDLDPKFDFFGKICIGDWVYIGNDVQIMPGVTLGDHTLVAAGSIVTKSFTGGDIIGGNPARKIGTIKDLAARMECFNLRSKGMSGKEKKKLLLSLDDSMFIRK